MYTELFSPLFATLEGLPIVVIGILLRGDIPMATYFDDEGHIGMVDLVKVVADWRFDPEGRWVNVAPEVDDAHAPQGR